MKSRSALLTGIAVTGLLLGACGGGGDNNAAAPPASSSSAPASSEAGKPSGEAAEWTNKFCGALKPLQEASQLEPPKMEGNDPAAARRVVLETFQKLETGVGGLVDGLKELPPAPIQSGEAAKTAFLGIFEPLRNEAKTAQEKFEATKPGDLNALRTAAASLTSVGTKLTKAEDPLKNLPNAQELKEAGKGQPNCESFGN
ncbi:hypothetical protein [Amycolatopsis suaedae]|uniref:Small secreted protein n=1 Tax=Amycolatopsis suaedae TaxID=2510978 RepID=A0A4Q7J4L5_9PSEU|nr:hypothetical protein [Amycolatopsis suaedae]RZQ61612.1 hypothetical protein EWH70_21820 [Amycolatopsis suaedae]